MIVVGLVFHMISLRTCSKIVEKTSKEPDGLTYKESWQNRQFTKWRKLSILADNSKNEELRNYAKKTMKLEIYTYVSFFFGMLMFFIGVSN